MSDPAAKIAKLLALAKDRAGTVEGETARKLAEDISFRHGVDCVAAPEEGAEDVLPPRVAKAGVPYLMATADAPVTWATMLLDGLCMCVFGGRVSTVYGWPGSDEAWSLYVLPEEDTDVETLEELFDVCCYEIERLVPSGGLRDPGRSVAFGVVYGVLVRLWWLTYHELPIAPMVRGEYPAPTDIQAWDEGVRLSRTHFRVF